MRPRDKAGREVCAHTHIRIDTEKYRDIQRSRDIQRDTEIYRDASRDTERYH